jgi:hypothetical protein
MTVVNKYTHDCDFTLLLATVVDTAVRITASESKLYQTFIEFCVPDSRGLFQSV